MTVASAASEQMLAKPAALFPYVLGLADDALVLGHRLSEWSGKAPMLAWAGGKDDDGTRPRGVGRRGDPAGPGRFRTGVFQAFLAILQRRMA